MEKIIKWGIVAVILYFAFTEGGPYIKSLVNKVEESVPGSSGSSGGMRCVQAAERASESFAKSVSRGRLEIEEWGSAKAMAQGRIQEARNLCDCGLDSCNKALEAMSELEGLVLQFDSGYRGGTPPLSAATHQERVNELLASAHALARQDS